MSLFDDVKYLKIVGERISGEPEVIHEIEDDCRREGICACRDQIKWILKNVPSIFPEDWQSPESFDGLTTEQKQCFLHLQKMMPFFPVDGKEIEFIIQRALYHREIYGSLEEVLA